MAEAELKQETQTGPLITPPESESMPGGQSVAMPQPDGFTREVNLYGYPVTVMRGPVGEYVWREIENEAWKPALFGVFRRLLWPGMIYVDIGAYAGSTVLWPALHGCQCYAFECDPVAYPVLCANVALNPDARRNVHLLSPAAIADRHGPREIGPRGAWGASTTGMEYVGRYDHVPPIMVWAMSLEEAVEHYHIPRIDFLKVNVQGSEAQLLWAARGYLEQFRPIVHVYYRAQNLRNIKADTEVLCAALAMYPYWWREDGTPLVPADLLSEEVQARNDLPFLVTPDDWPGRAQP